VLALNGASQIYPMLANRFGAAKAFIPSPSFGEYQRIFKNCTNYDDKVGFDLKGIERGSKDAEIVVFVNPNNPTGSLIQPDWIYSFAEKHAGQTIIADESFIEFADVPSVLFLLEKKPLNNILIIKSLSKSLGVPGIRLGYAYSCNEEIMKYLRGQVPIWNMNSIAEHYLEIILKHRNALKRSFEQTAKDRAVFGERLATCPQVERVYPSAGNFLLVELKAGRPSAAQLTDRLLEKHSIYVKDVTGKLSNGKAYIRLAVRLPEENERLVTALREMR
jgi:histidinol-phosphate/aromatic aminotransferase/cobyric acid decarboxylase-like protein